MDESNLLQLLPESLSPASALFLVAVSALTSAISASFGLGGGVAMLLALLMVVSPAAALPVHGVIQIGSNAGRVLIMREHVMLTLLWWFIPGALLGIYLASLVFVDIPVPTLQLVLAAFVLWSIWRPKLRSRAWSEKYFMLLGGLSSFCTMFVGATGPLLAIFLTPVRFGRDATVSTHAACMTLQHSLKVVAFGYLGFAYTQWLPLIVAMIVSGFVGTSLGVRVLKGIPEATFRHAFKAVLTLLALRLVYLALLG